MSRAPVTRRWDIIGPATVTGSWDAVFVEDDGTEFLEPVVSWVLAQETVTRYGRETKSPPTIEPIIIIAHDGSIGHAELAVDGSGPYAGVKRRRSVT